MVDRPLVSVVIPTYNQAAYLTEAIDSVLAQDYAPLEVIVVDDGSTDATPTTIAGYADRVISIRQPNHGAAHALNQGIRAARGDLICWLSSDDAFQAGKIERQVEAFAREPGLGLCFTGFETVDSAGEHLRDASDLAWVHPDLFVTVFWKNPINGSTAMVPRSVFRSLGTFDERLRADVDGEMWLRILDHHPARHIKGNWLRYRVHGGALSANRALMRASKTNVRLGRLRDGSLLRHLHASGDPNPGNTLAAMSLEFSRTGLSKLADALLDAARREGAGAELLEQARASRQAFEAKERSERARERRLRIRQAPLLAPARACVRLWRARRSRRPIADDPPSHR
jgi:hypothetical protein